MTTYSAIRMAQGETLSDRAWVFCQTPLKPSDLPSPLADTTGWFAHLTVRAYRGAASAILDLRTDTGGLTLVNGVLRAVLSEADSLLLADGVWYHEIVTSDASGITRVTQFRGPWIIEKAMVKT